MRKTRRSFPLAQLAILLFSPVPTLAEDYVNESRTIIGPPQSQTERFHFSLGKDDPYPHFELQIEMSQGRADLRIIDPAGRGLQTVGARACTMPLQPVPDATTLGNYTLELVTTGAVGTWHLRVCGGPRPPTRCEMPECVRDAAMIRVRTRYVVSAIIGAIVGALLFCPIGALSNTVSIAAAVGAVVGGAVAIGICSGWISVPTAGGIVTAVLAAALGTGCDDYSGLMSVPGFLVGMGMTCGVRALVGEFGVRLAFLCPAIIVGVVAIATAEPIWFVMAAMVGLLTLVWIPGNDHTGMPSRSPNRVLLVLLTVRRVTF